MLDSKDIEILFAIQNNPLATLSQISKQINLSVSNTSARLQKLEKEQKEYYGVIANLNLKALDLEFYDFFFETKTKESVIFLEEKFSYNHPYVYYRGRCNGKFNGLFIQFIAPKEALNYLEEIAQILKSKDIIQNYYYIKRLPNEKIVNIKSSLNNWDPKRNQWIFDWESWKNNFDTFTNEQHSESNKPYEKILKQLTELDIKLLAELTIDARRKNITMMKNIGLKNNPGDAQKVSRHLRFLKDYAINDYRVFLHWATFDLYQSIIIRGYCNELTAIKLRNYLLAHNQNTTLELEAKRIIFPFQGIYFITEKGFFWYIRAPPSHLSKFIDFIWDICPQYDLYILDYRYSQIYGLWDQTFNLEHKKWKLSYDFMIKDVLNKIL